MQRRIVVAVALLGFSAAGSAEDLEADREAQPGAFLLEDAVQFSAASMMAAPPPSPAPAPLPAESVPEPTWPVSGIYTVPDTKDLGTLTGIPWLEGVKIRGWIDTYYVYNFNKPDRLVVNPGQPLSIVKGRDVSIEGRTFDIHHNSFARSLAEVEIEKVPERGGVGFKLDLALGETQDIMVDTIKAGVGASAATDSVSDADRVFQHASVSYQAPIGNGLRIDVGKFVTHIGGETIETVKNWNYSHGFFYTYAIPFQDTGIHASYPWTGEDSPYGIFYTDVYFLNGLNVTIDNNPGKTFGPAFGWIPNKWLQVYLNYLVGNEQTDDDSNERHLVDAQVFLGPFKDLSFLVNLDYGFEENPVPPNPMVGLTKDTSWRGIAGYARYKVCRGFEPSIRYEYYKDDDGVTTGVGQELQSLTLTLNTILGLGKSKGSMLLLRPEVRYDWSTATFFSDDNTFRDKSNQFTVGMGVAWVF